MSRAASAHLVQRCPVVLWPPGREDMRGLGQTLLLIFCQLARPAPTLHTQEVVLAAGENLELLCALENENENVVIWKKNSRVLYAGNIRVRHDPRLEVGGEQGSLMIRALAAEDEGDYSCEIEDDQGRFKVFRQRVTVLQRATVEINQVGSHLAVKLGTHLALRCTGSGVPEPEVIWRRGGDILSRGLGEAGLLLEYITREDAGEIVCEASNGVGDTAARDVLSLDVLYAPQVEMMSPHISFQPKCGLELQCQVHSSSPPSVSWYHNHLQLQPDDGVTIWSLDNLHVLQISSCDHSIIGQFSCRATNNLGDGEAEADISEQWLQQELEMFRQEEENINNVRRNVVHRQEHSLPLTSSSPATASAVVSVSVSVFLYTIIFVV